MAYTMDHHMSDHVVPMHDTGAEAGPAQTAAPAMSGMPVRLKQTGGRAMTFSGVELGMAMSFTPEIPYWYEINVWRTDRDFVVAVKRFNQAEDDRDLCRAWRCASLGEVADRLEGYDAADDVVLRGDPLSDDMSVAEMASMALELKAQVVAARTHFGGLVGEFLYEIDQGEGA